MSSAAVFRTASPGAPSTGIPGGLGGPLAGSSEYRIGGTRFDAYLNAMEQAGVMKTLAEPTLTAVSGDKATFRVGGEYNILRQFTGGTPILRNPDGTIADKGSADSYSYNQIEWGIGLEFKPVVLSPAASASRSELRFPSRQTRRQAWPDSSPIDCLSHSQAAGRHHGGDSVRRLNDDCRACPGRCQADGQRCTGHLEDPGSGCAFPQPRLRSQRD